MIHAKSSSLIESSFNFTGDLRPFPYSFTGRREVPKRIERPDYAESGQPASTLASLKSRTVPPIHTDKEIAKIRKACKIARGAIDAGHRAVKPGVTTEHIDKIVHDFIISQGAYPSPLNYYGFPRSCCTSVNEVICHGIPDTRPL